MDRMTMISVENKYGDNVRLEIRQGVSGCDRVFITEEADRTVVSQICIQIWQDQTDSNVKVHIYPESVGFTAIYHDEVEYD